MTKICIKITPENTFLDDYDDEKSDDIHINDFSDYDSCDNDK